MSKIMDSLSVLRSIKPYYLYLILLGKKYIEVGKVLPKNKKWDRKIYFYCSQDKESFLRIPEVDREWMEQYLGKVVCWFYCPDILIFGYDEHIGFPTPAYEGDPSFCDCGPGYWITCKELEETCLNEDEFNTYGQGKELYGFVIHDLVTLSKLYDITQIYGTNGQALTRPPQSYMYIKSTQLL